MKKTHITYILMLLYLVAISPKIFAQELVPATSEDIAEFDRQVAKQLERQGNFGKQVAAEAKKLKDQSPEERKKLGKWVSDQRKKTDQGRPSAEGSLGGKQNSRRMDGEKGKRKNK